MLLDPGEEIARAAGLHVGHRGHSARSHAHAHLLDRADHGSVVLHDQVDEAGHALTVGQIVDQRIALHLFFQVILGDVEPELVPVSALGVAVQKSRLVFAQRVVPGKLGDVLDAQLLLPIAAQGLDPLGGGGVAVVE